MGERGKEETSGDTADYGWVFVALAPPCRTRRSLLPLGPRIAKIIQRANFKAEGPTSGKNKSKRRKKETKRRADGLSLHIRATVHLPRLQSETRRIRHRRARDRWKIFKKKMRKQFQWLSLQFGENGIKRVGESMLGRDEAMKRWRDEKRKRWRDEETKRWRDKEMKLWRDEEINGGEIEEGDSVHFRWVGFTCLSPGCGPPMEALEHLNRWVFTHLQRLARKERGVGAKWRGPRFPFFF